MDRRLTGIALAIGILTIGAPVWGQVPKSPVAATWTTQHEPGSQLLPGAQPPFSPRDSSATVAAPAVAQSAQPPLRAPDITAVGSGSSNAPQVPKKINENRKPREGHPANDSAAADLNRQELSRIAGGGYRAPGY